MKIKSINKDKSGIKVNKKSKLTLKESLTDRNPLKGIKNFLKFAFVKKSQIIIADMQLSTGDFEHVPVHVINNEFKFKKGKYLVDDKYLVYNKTFKMWTCKYHENISLPIKQHINSINIKKSLDNYKSLDIKNDSLKPEDVISNIDPVILAKWSESTLVQQAIAGAEMKDVIESLKNWVIVGCIAGIISLLILIQMSGILNV